MCVLYEPSMYLQVGYWLTDLCLIHVFFTKFQSRRRPMTDYMICSHILRESIMFLRVIII